jgi:thiamine monophosphate kinase
MSPDLYRCQRLWQAVILQSLRDACATLPKKRKDRHSASERHAAEQARNAARRWLLKGGKDFETVCQAANIPAEYVQRRARDLETAGWSVNISETELDQDAYV